MSTIEADLKKKTYIEGKELRNTAIISVSFMVVFTAHIALQNLQSSLHEEEQLGIIALSCLYGSIIFSGILAPTFIGAIGAKGCIIASWIGHLIYTSANFYPTWGTLIPASILLGIFFGPLWTSQSLYISACAYSYSGSTDESPYSVLSRLNGLFFMMYETTQITGNLISSLVLQHSTYNMSDENITKYCGPHDCPGHINSTNIEEPDEDLFHLLLGIFLSLEMIGLFITIVFLSSLPKSDWTLSKSVKESLASCFVTLVKSEILFLVPFIMFQAMEQAILLGDFTKSYISCPLGIHMVGFVMACYGAATAVFAFVFSRLAKYTGRYLLFLMAFSTNMALLIFLYFWTPSSDNPVLIFAIPTIWGIAESIWQTQSSSLIALLFSDKKEPAFANYHTWKAVGFTLTFIYGSFLCVSVKLLIAASLLGIGMVLYVYVEVRIYFKEKAALRGPPSRDNATVQETT
ncbi:hypothetical protein SNE40_004185 [Patella caerulea]|uniref:Protein unc-93 homolog A n=1 Tax=Patella caerulea TaxID=87958 RepID=A0AAN8Q9G9_PATCE